MANVTIKQISKLFNHYSEVFSKHLTEKINSIPLEDRIPKDDYNEITTDMQKYIDKIPCVAPINDLIRSKSTVKYIKLFDNPAITLTNSDDGPYFTIKVKKSDIPYRVRLNSGYMFCVRDQVTLLMYKKESSTLCCVKPIAIDCNGDSILILEYCSAKADEDYEIIVSLKLFMNQTLSKSETLHNLMPYVPKANKSGNIYNYKNKTGNVLLNADNTEMDSDGYLKATHSNTVFVVPRKRSFGSIYDICGAIRVNGKTLHVSNIDGYSVSEASFFYASRRLELILTESAFQSNSVNGGYTGNFYNDVTYDEIVKCFKKSFKFKMHRTIAQKKINALFTSAPNEKKQELFETLMTSSKNNLDMLNKLDKIDDIDSYVIPTLPIGVLSIADKIAKIESTINAECSTKRKMEDASDERPFKKYKQ